MIVERNERAYPTAGRRAYPTAGGEQENQSDRQADNDEQEHTGPRQPRVRCSGKGEGDDSVSLALVDAAPGVLAAGHAQAC